MELLSMPAWGTVASSQKPQLILSICCMLKTMQPRWIISITTKSLILFFGSDGTLSACRQSAATAFNLKGCIRAKRVFIITSATTRRIGRAIFLHTLP